MKASCDVCGYHRGITRECQGARAEWGKLLQFRQQNGFSQGLGEIAGGYRVSHYRKRYPKAISASLD